MKAIQIQILDNRLECEADWIIFNAPRPLYGDVVGKGEFLYGIFYAAVNPNGDFAEQLCRENLRLDAVVCKYVTMDEIVYWVQQFCKRKGYDFNELDNNDVRQCFSTENGIQQIDIVLPVRPVPSSLTNTEELLLAGQ